MKRTELRTIILSMNNDCEFVSDQIFQDKLFYISEFKDQTKMINPHYSYNEQSFAPSSSPWITTVNLSVTRFLLMYSSKFLNSEIKQRWLTHITVIMIDNTGCKVFHCRKQKIYLNFTAFCSIGNDWIVYNHHVSTYIALSTGSQISRAECASNYHLKKVFFWIT